MREVFIALLERLFGLFYYKDVFLCAAVLAAAIVAYIVVSKLLVPVVRRILERLTRKTKTELDNYLFKYVRLGRLALATFALAFNFLSGALLYGGVFFRKAGALIVIWIVIKLIHDVLDGLAAFTENDKRYVGKPYRSYIQVFILLAYIAAAVIAGGTISGKSPWALLSGIGAMTAVLLLVFRETILSFVASLQIASYDLVRKGDWISVPKYDADGDVTEVALHTIKIQNWDKTISVVPTHDLMQSGFRNWRGMQETGGRRIKRSIFIDVSSVHFMDKELRERTGKINLLKPYFAEIEESLHATYSPAVEHPLNDNRLTNLGTFRIYITKYLQSLDSIRKDLTFLVRQLEPGATGIPLEIYVFTATTVWNEYEAIQADIFDHLLSAAGEFELRVFQYPASGFMPH
ncbi:MAG: mechanosensitive ion channel family protein [Treponema sp.]